MTAVAGASRKPDAAAGGGNPLTLGSLFDGIGGFSPQEQVPAGTPPLHRLPPDQPAAILRGTGRAAAEASCGLRAAAGGGNPLTLGSLFDGIGGFPLAAMRNGIVPLWASEIEAFPMEVTRLRFPNMLHVGDITKLDGAKLPPVDILCGGSPCQDLSTAGKRKGLAGERSGLFMEQIRITKEMRTADEYRGKTAEFVRPRWFCWENVPGAFSSGTPKGEDFRIVLEEVCRIKRDTLYVPRPERSWEPVGLIVLGDTFSLAWRVLDAQYWGVAQRRRRIFLVADFAGRSAGKILFEQDSLPGYSQESKGTGQGIAGAAQGSADGPGGIDTDTS